MGIHCTCTGGFGAVVGRADYTIHMCTLPRDSHIKTLMQMVKCGSKVPSVYFPSYTFAPGSNIPDQRPNQQTKERQRGAGEEDNTVFETKPDLR